MINKRLSELSCNKYEFDKAKVLKEKLLQESGYETSISYAQTEVKTSKNRSRNIIWFNTPFSQNAKINIGQMFLKLIKEDFQNHHCLHKILNLSTIKLSYSCMSNMSSFIKQHSRNILSSPPNSEERSCNFRKKKQLSTCWQLLENVLCYRADVIKQNESHVYYGESDGEFKYRQNNYTNFFRNEGYENKTQPSKHIRKLNRNRTEFNLKWSITAYATPYRCGTRRCDLCLTEKYIIAQANQNNLLNMRTE